MTTRRKEKHSDGERKGERRLGNIKERKINTRERER